MSNIIHLHETVSTNQYVKDMLKSGVHFPDFTVVETDFQTAGRGQSDHKWESQRGANILMSIIIHPLFLDAKDQFIISQSIAISIQRTLSEYIDDVRVKRPNDIYWRDKKISGILIECNLESTRIKDCVIGIGLNVNQTKFCSDAPNPVSLATIVGLTFDKSKIQTRIMEHFRQLYDKIQQGNTQEIIDEYERNIYDPTTYKD